jgi:hypothetical protein
MWISRSFRSRNHSIWHMLHNCSSKQRLQPSRLCLNSSSNSSSSNSRALLPPLQVQWTSTRQWTGPLEALRLSRRKRCRAVALPFQPLQRQSAADRILLLQPAAAASASQFDTQSHTRCSCSHRVSLPLNSACLSVALCHRFSVIQTHFRRRKKRFLATAVITHAGAGCR